MRSASVGAAALASLAFVALGLPDGLLGVAWPSMRAFFGLPLDALGPLLVSFTGGYVLASSGGGRLLARLGLGPLLILSCLATGASLLGYAVSGSWPLVIALALVGGVGAGGIDTGINTYAATHHSSRMLNSLHACYGIGATGGPAIMTAVLAAHLPWQRGYAIVGAAQLTLAATFAASLRAWPAATAEDRSAGTPTAPIRATLRLPAARCSILLFLVYTGLELAVGAWTFTLLAEGRGVPMVTAGSTVSLYWAALTAGRVLGAVAADRVAVDRLLTGCLVALTAGLALLAAGLSPRLDVAAMVLAGAAAGPVFPTLIAATPARVGKAHAGNAVGLQIAAAAVGQSLLPSLLGVVGDRFGPGTLAAGLALLGVLVVTICRALARAAHATDVTLERLPRTEDAIPGPGSGTPVPAPTLGGSRAARRAASPSA